ncbi:putative bifunctional diguanylate cyclase/phosphodiesterase [Geodermatophilus sp. URMC 60]
MASDDEDMPVSASPRLLPGTPRWALAVVVALAAAGAVGVVLVPAPDPLAPAHFLPALAMHGGLCVLLVRRALGTQQERVVWVRVALSALVFTACALCAGVLGLVPATRAVAAVPLAWAPVLAFPFVYGGLVRWNRFGTTLADPNDVLNGSSAVLAAVALGNAVAAGAGSPLLDLPWWHSQALLGQAATGVVLLGTALSVIGLGAMGRDPRSWLVAGTFAVSSAGSLGTLVAGGVPVTWLSAAQPIGVVCLGVAAVLRPGRVAPQPTDPAASTIGAFVVILVSTGVLVSAAVTGTAGPATWCAALAATGAGLRLLVNVRELSQLTVSRQEALTDELTGRANRRAVLRRVEDVCREGIPLVFALLDLDKFKEVNDGLGHAAGDDLLRLVANRLQPVLRTGDMLGRLGGDEFAVVAVLDAGTDPEQAAESLGRRLGERLARPFHVGGMSVHVAASIGLALRTGTTDDESGTAQLLLQQADAAMYSAKRSGTTLAVYDAARHGDGSGHLALVEDLREGLRTGQLVLHHQPQVDVATGRTVGVETLVRWAHPDRGLLGPAEFLPLAEVHGLMGPLTEEVLRQAVAQAAAWRGAGRRLRMSVNLSASNLLDIHLPARVAALLRDAGLPAGDLVLEVTESVLISDPERSLAVVGRLADLGVTVSIDDFGTGYSSLSYLRELPVAELKLDRSFTAGLLTDPRTEAIVASTIGLAHRLGLRVVAEGVEQAATLTRLAALGCDESQGYLHSPPLPADRLEAWLDRTGTSPRPELLRS